MNHWKKLYSGEKILICAPSNTAADFIALKLNDVKSLRNHFVRVITDYRENLIHADFDKIDSYSLLYRVYNYKDDAKIKVPTQAYIKALEAVENYFSQFMPEFKEKKKEETKEKEP